MRKILMSGSVAILFFALAAGAIFAQHEHNAAPKSSVPAVTASKSPVAAAAKKPSDPDEIFCPTMKTGQLCSHGTSDALSLEDAKRETWIAAVRRFNKTVDDATSQLLLDSKDILDPAKSKEVERWFEKGAMNPKINALLDADKKKAAKRN